MTIKFLLRGTKEIKTVYVRLYQSKLDISCTTNIPCIASEFSEEKQKFKSQELDNTFLKLKLNISDSFSRDYSNGACIDKKWLENVIKSSFGRHESESRLEIQKHTIYFSDFCQWWLKNHAGNWRTSFNKKMSLELKAQYERFYKILEGYEKSNDKITFKSINSDLLYNFCEYLADNNYMPNTIERLLGRFRFFISRAVEFKITLPIKTIVYIEKDEDVDAIFLSEKEINSILKLDVSHDQELNITKQYFTIGIRTGLRFSDFGTQLSLDNITEDHVKIVNKKTNKLVLIPLHNEVKSIIKNNFGNLPPKQSLRDFNDNLRKLGMLANIDNKVKGYKSNGKSKNKIKGYFKKYELLTSHCIRRSFATMYVGKIPNESLQSIMGWTSDKMVKLYNKTSKESHSEVLKNIWDNN